ncbi:phage late control D family protein [Sorangium sp. So ce426]|uniref:phage late control D family protein n=1 Tax=unclassified Sorangium TaxID=2621164 RepID=UPI003F5C19DD
MPDAQSRTPDVAVLLNGRPLPEEAYRDLRDVAVQEDLDAPSQLTLRLSAWNDERRSLSWAEDDLFDIGGEIEIQLGYSGKLETLLFGDIMRLELDLQGGESPSFVVSACDRRYRMQRGRKKRKPFVKLKDSDIAAEIARDKDYGLTPDVVDSGIQLDHVEQDRVSDHDFLRQRASSIGYEVLVRGKTLHFQPRRHGAAPDLVLEAGSDLLEFSAQMSVGDIPSAVEVRGWDPKTKSPIIGRAAAADQSSMGKVAAAAAAQRALGDAPLVVADRNVATQEEADRIAREQLEAAALGFVQASGACLGRTDLRAGIVIEVKSVGRFEGRYYVTSTSHSYSPQRGYRTSFSARRNAT